MLSKGCLGIEHTARDLRVPNLMLRAIDETNDIQKEYLVRRFLKEFSVIDKRITVLGLAFKPDTDDVEGTFAGNCSFTSKGGCESDSL